MDKVVIVMPAWNEAENIKEMIGVLIGKEFPTIKADTQLLVVDNHSKDGTDTIVKDASKKYNGWEVPKVLLNGNHAEIDKWRGLK